MNNPTPGPWTIHKSPTDSFESHVITGNPRKTPHPFVGSVRHAEDARLISAAPELLAGAHYALSGLEFLAELIAEANIGAVGTGYLKAIPALRAAIAKAEGS